MNLNHLAKKAICEKNTSKLFELICRETASQLNVSRVGIWKYFSDFGIIKCLKQYEQQHDKFTSGLVLSEVDYPGLFEELKKEKSLESTDLASDDRIPGLVQNYLMPLDVQSILYIPFYMEGELAGVLSLEKQGQKREWQEFDQMHGQAVSETITIALMQHNLLEALETIRIQNDAILNQNQILENTVKARTLEMERKNEILKNVFNMNANQLYGSICTIIGLLDLLSTEKGKDDTDHLLQLLRVPVNKLESMVKKINADILSEEPESQANTPNAYLPENL